jgi:hypothetical protein
MAFGLFAFVYMLLPRESAEDMDPAAPSSVLSHLNVLLPVLAALFFGAIASNVWQVQTQQRKLRRIALAIFREKDVTQDLSRLTKSRFGGVAADAEVMLADVNERACNFEEAIRCCDRAIARISKDQASRAAGHDTLLPLAIAERAFCLAASGRQAEADAELANLQTFKAFALMARSVFRIRLARALASGPKAALEVARSRTMDLPLSHRDELLCDVLEATEGHGADENEWARIDEELREDPELAAYVEHFLPGARARLAPRKRVALEEAVAAAQEAALAERSV